MLRFKNYIIVFFLTLLFVQLHAQTESVVVPRTDMAKIFEKMNAWFRNTPSYSLTITHASYENYSTVVPEEKAIGYFKKDNQNYHSFLIGIHTVQNSKYKFVIDTSEKMILVANPDQLAWSSYTPDDYDALLKNCISIKMTTVGKDKLYKINLPANFPIAAYEFLVNSDGLPKEIVWYYNQEIQKDENDEKSKVKPRVSIRFSDYKTSTSFNYKMEFSEELYFVNQNSVLKTIGKYKGFKLSDQRIRN